MRSGSDQTAATAPTAVRLMWLQRQSHVWIANFGLFDASPIVLNPATGGAGRDFANAVAIVESSLSPLTMLKSLKTTERDLAAEKRQEVERAGARPGHSCLGAAANSMHGASIFPILALPIGRSRSGFWPELRLRGASQAQQMHNISQRALPEGIQFARRTRGGTGR